MRFQIMDSIRKKMQSLKAETDLFKETADKYDAQAKELNAAADKNDATIRDLGKKIGKIEASLDDTSGKLQRATVALEDKEKSATDAEDEVNAIARKVQLLEIEAKDAENRMGDFVKDLAVKSREADQILKRVRYFESKNMTSEMTIEEQEKDLKEASNIVSYGEKKLDEITRKMGVMEDELKRALERAEIAESNLAHIEDELKTVGENMKTLEVSEEKAVCREEKFKEQIKGLIERLKWADARAEYGEMTITKLNIRIDEIEDDIVREKLKLKKLSDELGDTFDEMLTKY